DSLPRVRPYLVSLAVQLVLGEILDRHGPERVEPDVQGHALDVESRNELRREVQSGRRRSGRAGFVCVHRLVPRQVVQRLDDVGRQWRLPCRLAVEADSPTAGAEVLEQL